MKRLLPICYLVVAAIASAILVQSRPTTEKIVTRPAALFRRMDSSSGSADNSLSSSSALPSPSKRRKTESGSRHDSIGSTNVHDSDSESSVSVSSSPSTSKVTNSSKRKRVSFSDNLSETIEFETEDGSKLHPVKVNETFVTKSGGISYSFNSKNVVIQGPYGKVFSEAVAVTASALPPVISIKRVTLCLKNRPFLPLPTSPIHESFQAKFIQHPVTREALLLHALNMLVDSPKLVKLATGRPAGMFPIVQVKGKGIDRILLELRSSNPATLISTLDSLSDFIISNLNHLHDFGIVMGDIGFCNSVVYDHTMEKLNFVDFGLARRLVTDEEAKHWPSDSDAAKFLEHSFIRTSDERIKLGALDIVFFKADFVDTLIGLSYPSQIITHYTRKFGIRH